MRNNYPKTIIELLITKGAEINAEDKTLVTPLLIGVSTNSSEEIIKLLVSHGAEINLNYQILMS